jgi:competence protein ComEC
MKRPVLLLACALGLGVILGSDLAAPDALPVLALGAALLPLAWVARPAFGGLAVLAASVAFGASLIAVEHTEYQRSPLGRWVQGLPRRELVRAVGRADADAWESGDDWWLLIEVDRIESRGRIFGINGRIKVRVGGRATRPEVIQGDRVSVWTTLHRPRGFGDRAADDVQGRAFRNGIQAFGYCKSPLVVETTRPSWAERGLLDRLGLARAWARRALVHFIPAGPELDVTRAMVLGDKAGLDERTAEAFRIAGTYHVLAISGAQVALVGLLLLVPLRRTGVPRLVQAVVVSTVLGAYALFVGGDVPVVRAAVMAGLLLAGRTLDLDGDGANILGLAGLALLASRPSSLGDAGFQLSFAATLGLLLLSVPVQRIARLPEMPFRLDLALAVSLGAQLALQPLLIHLFHRVAPAALLLNLVAVPLSTAVLLGGWGVIAASLIGVGMARALGWVTWLFARGLVLSGDVVRLVPALDARLPSPSPAAAAVYLVGLVLLAAGRRTGAALGLCVLGLVGLLWGSPAPLADGRLRLEILDVGQGDCIVIHSPTGRVMVVDAGGSFDRPFEFGESVVGPHLWAQGVRSIDHLVVTHAHPDHVGGVPFLLRSFRVGDLWEGPAPTNDPIYRGLDARARAEGVVRRTVVRGLSASLAGAELEILWPPTPRSAHRRTRNDDSVVLRVWQGETAFLLTGDLEARGEAGLANPASTVLKVPHHGSRTSSTPGLIRRVGPLAAAISVGYHSSFGHPHSEVLERYRRAGVRLFRTDLDGTVRFASDGHRLWVETDRSGLRERLK